MKISGFTIIRNAIINDYPAVEAITSILPVVDEMVVAVGESDDDTEGLIRSIGSDKIRIVHSTWDLSQLPGGKVMALETDKAFAHVSADSDWAFYIQCDEVVHEKYHLAIRKACERLPSKLIEAEIYHYGWVKNPALMDKKLRTLSTNWMGKQMKDRLENMEGVFNYDEFDSLEKFKGTHPVVMGKRINEKNWELNVDVTKKRFTPKKYFLYLLEKFTGIRPFTFKNYKLI